VIKLPGFLKWRYELYVSEYVDLYGSLGFFIRAIFNNLRYGYNPKIAYIYANKGNVGDYISHCGIRDSFNKPGLWLFCSPVWSRYLVRNLARLKKRNPNCILIIGGGGLLQPVFENFWSLVIDSGLTFVMVGIGINELEGRGTFDQKLLKNIVSKSSYLTVRDSYTQKRILDISGALVPVTVCPSVRFLQQYREKNRRGEKKKLLHVLHPADLRMAGIDIELLRNSVREAAVCLNLDYQESTNMSSNHITAITGILDSAIVVSSRLHGCIMSYALDIPFVALECDRKIKYFIETHTGNAVLDPRTIGHNTQLIQILEKTMNSQRGISQLDRQLDEYDRSIEHALDFVPRIRR